MVGVYLIVSFKGDGASSSSNTETKPGLVSLQSGDNGLQQIYKYNSFTGPAITNIFKSLNSVRHSIH